LPRSTISRLAKEALPEGSQIPKDGLLALLRSSTVFISYLSAEANGIAHDACRKIVQPQDVFRALEAIGLGSFVPSVRAEVERK
jgi:histone H3/H4